jgi:hypothetical protein
LPDPVLPPDSHFFGLLGRVFVTLEEMNQRVTGPGPTNWCGIIGP